MIRVPKAELQFAWRHKKGFYSICVILHNDKIIRQGNYADMSRLFYELVYDNPEPTVAIKYEDICHFTSRFV